MARLGLLDIKQALWDRRFRGLFPEYREDIEKFLKDPGCTCHAPLYKKLFSHSDRLATYFPTKEVTEAPEEKVVWAVINCHVGELEGKLRKLAGGRKQVAVARWEDQVTVVVSEG